ncbi:MAG: HipA domain-containing protein [Gammaproteobacteria bacterium]|nr:HipA domain-containing protein [Gammaproteobacteria bacterium]MDH5650961.1 HipA domain-containing protein [Gammaproteobacteria bacterium]
MSTDRSAVIWTRLHNIPRKMGQLYVTDKECRFTYDADYLNLDQPGLGLVYDPAYFGLNTISRKRSEKFNLLPPVQSLIPPLQEDNFQRNLALKYLNSIGKTGLSGFDADWEILKVSGRGGIGHLDLFEDDEKAEHWYNNPPVHQLHEVTDEFGFSLKEFMAWFEDDIEVLIQTVGPTPSVGGAIPKLLVSIPETGWDGRIGAPTRQSTVGVTDVILKFEQTNRYPGITELESMALDMYRNAGFDVPRHWICHFKGMPALAIERFDRDASRAPVFTETLYSIFASGLPNMVSHYDYTYDNIAKAINVSPVRIVNDATEGKEHLFRCVIMSLITGNGDLHLENLSILIDSDNVRRFTPIYDPTPMRAYSQHDMISVMPFGDYGDIVDGYDKPIGLTEAVHRFSAHCGIRKKQFNAIVSELLDKTADYESMINQLQTVPDANKERLIKRIADARKHLGVMLDGEKPQR